MLDATRVVCPEDGQRTLMFTSPSDPKIGQILDGRFTLLGVLGTGGMGVVYRALQHSMEREVAVKLLRRSFAKQELAVGRFMQEARAASRLSHPNIISIFDFGQIPEGELYLVMERLLGRSLEPIMAEEGRLKPERAVALSIQICDALEAAHQEGVIHRDLKPENIIITTGASRLGEFVKVIDFGIAKVQAGFDDESEDLTATGTLVGTPLYVSPEQILNHQQADARSDVYSLGILLYEMLSGEAPFLKDSALECLRAHVRDAPPPLRSLCPEVTEPLASAVHQALEKSPRDRPRSAAAFKELLIEASESLSHDPIEIEPSPPQQRWTNLAESSSTFVGRERDMRVLDRLYRVGHRLVTLHGPAGIGKTRLAVQYGLSRLAAQEEDAEASLWLCDLTDAFTLDMMCEEIGRVLEVSLDIGETDLVEKMGEALADRGVMLLILDNFDQLAEMAGEILTPWLQQAPRLSFLVTSRQRLRLPAETVHELGPLDLPKTDGVVETSDAVKLYVDRAARAGSGFELSPELAPTVADIVRKLEGIPLAIELAAARAPLFGPVQLLQRLENRFQILGGTMTSRRQMTLHQAIDWSWSLLEPTEQRALAQLSVFHGGFSMEAVEQIVDLTDFENPPWAGDVISSLHDKSLVRIFEPPGFPGEVRLSLYESIREFAAEKLTELEEVGEAEARHSAYYLWVCGEWSEEIRERGNPAMSRRLSQDMENVEAVHHRAIGSEPLTTEGVEQAILALLVVDPVAIKEGITGVHFKRLEEALEIVSRKEVRPELVARLAFARARMLSRCGRFEAAIGHLEGALEIGLAASHRRVEAECLTELGFCWAARSEPEKAISYLEAARKIVPTLQSPMLSCELEKFVGTVNFLLHRYELAITHLSLAADIARENGFVLELAVNLHNLGDVYARFGRYDMALTVLNESQELVEKHGYVKIQEVNDLLLGCVEAVSTGRKESLQRVERAAAESRKTGNNWVVVQASFFLGQACAALGQIDQARQLLIEALELAQADDNQAFVYDCQRALTALDSERDTLPPES